jgi:hypothetical protein
MQALACCLLLAGVMTVSDYSIDDTNLYKPGATLEQKRSDGAVCFFGNPAPIFDRRTGRVANDPSCLVPAFYGLDLG